ncbi:MAG: LysR family transcriptional regulator [Bacilli bacterium]|nr:LysR family transcriptional regulator [Bacilli bacterium]
MDLKSLRYFVVVAEELNITRAAKILMMSQPPLSNQIKNLEDELQTKLFIRGRRSLKLTEEGKYLYQKAKDILSLSEKAQHDILLMNKGISGTIPIGLVHGSRGGIGAKFIAGFLKENPYVRFRVFSGDSDELIEKMQRGLLSVSIVYGPIDESALNTVPLMTIPWVAVFPKNHRFAVENEEKLSLSKLISEPLILPERKASADGIKKWFRKTKGEVNVICEVEEPVHGYALSKQGVGVAILPYDESMPESLSYRLIEGNEQAVPIYFAWRKGHQLSTIEENFIDYVKKYSYSL